MQSRLEELMVDVFHVGRGDITDAFSMKDTPDWDSLKHVELVVSIEQMSAVELAFDDIIAMRTVGDIKQVLRNKGVNGDNGSAG